MSRPPKERISFTIDPDLLEQVDAIADARDVSRSQVIERLLRLGLDEDREFLEQLGGGGGVRGLLIRQLFQHDGFRDALLSVMTPFIDPDELTEARTQSDRVAEAKGDLKKRAKAFRDRNRANNGRRSRARRDDQGGAGETQGA